MCVIDSGIDYTHPDLQGNIWVNHGEIPNNGVDDDKNGFIDDYYGWNFLSNSGDNMDNNYHGTHLSGKSLGPVESAVSIAPMPAPAASTIRVPTQ